MAADGRVGDHVRGSLRAAARGASRGVLIGVLALALAGIVPQVSRLEACTAFCAMSAGRMLVGNNEDSGNPRTRLWFVPAEDGRYGRLYVGYDDLFPQGGMNDRGLWFDGFVAPLVEADAAPPRAEFSGNLIDEAMAKCATVEDVIALFQQYDRGFLERAIVMFADASGDAVSIERRAMVRMSGPRFVQTNFHQSGATEKGPGNRFTTATAMLERAGDAPSVDAFRRILEATRQTGPVSTVYSNVYDLSSRTMYLYQLDRSSRPVTLVLDEELEQGARVIEIPALFATSPAGGASASRSNGRLVFLTGGATVAVLAAAWGLLRRRTRNGSA